MANNVVSSPNKLIRAATGNLDMAVNIWGLYDEANPNTIAARINRKNYSNCLKAAARQLREAADMIDAIQKKGL